MATKNNTPLTVETLKHDDDARKNIPTAELQMMVGQIHAGALVGSGRGVWYRLK